MSCPYEFYNEEETFYPRLYCNLDNKYCIYSKKCEKVYRFVSLENQEECYKYIMEMQKHIPKNSYFVETYRINKQGTLSLYVIVDDSVCKINTELKELKQNYVYLKKEGLNNWKVSLVPFTEKKVYTKKPTNKIENKNEK